MGAERAKTATVHVVEPTLQDYAGHCYSLVRSFADAASGQPIAIWGGKGADSLEFGSHTDARPYFHRRLRVVQLYWLVRRLLKLPGRILLMTARRSDLSLLDWAAQRAIPAGKVFVYFHWYRETPARLEYLKKMARVQPNIAILTTTQSLAGLFAGAGFKQVTWLPYPLTAGLRTARTKPEFNHLLYAGAARQDKGFRRVVDLVEHMYRRGEKIPVVVQISADHYGKYDEKTRNDIARLRRCDYVALDLVEESLSPERYAELYRGAICLQPYDPEPFQDRVSGITMDALAYGSPVIVPARTWMARLVEPALAGAVVQDSEPATLLSAVNAVRDDYDQFSRNASVAGAKLRERSWEPLLSLFA
jgi:glycosyltransferase involved in cell wall biosynthesis